jgi:hypothetical protein
MRQAILIIALSAGACSPYHLAATGNGPPASSHEQRMADVQQCTATARDQSQDPARAFATGLILPVAGIAVEYQAEKTAARQIFADCLQRRGWSGISPGTD